MKTTNKTLGARLAAALDLQARATEYVPEDNPFAGKAVEELAGTTGYPALNMAAKAPDDPAAYELEVNRTEAIRKGKDVTAAKRQAQARARAKKKIEWDMIAARDVQPDAERMTLAWRAVFPLVPIVTRIANGKQRWAARFLGSVVDDVAQVVLERMAVLLAKSDKDLYLLIRAADELGDQAERKGIPGDQLSESERADRKAMARARKWLMGMVNNRVQGTLVDLYTESRNLRWDNLDIITTVMASINGVGDDPLTANFKANRAPAFLGAQFQKPDGVDQALLATAINAAITERGLDLMVEIMLNEENRRSNGSVAWSKVAERVFMATPDGKGEWLWDLVCKATEHHDRPERAQADAARTHVRNLFGWLPGFIIQVVDSFDPHFVMWAEGRAIMASDFELYYLGDQDEVRRPLVPALTYNSVEDAVAALVGNIEVLTGNDLVNGLVNA